MAKQPIEIATFLAEIGRAVASTQVATIRTYVDTLLARDILDVSIPIGDDEIKIDGIGILPEGLPQLDTLTIRCETEVSVPAVDDGDDDDDDDEAVVPQIQMSLTKGLHSHGMHVEIEATYRRGGPVESLELLRQRANEYISEQLAAISMSTTTTPAKD